MEYKQNYALHVKFDLNNLVLLALARWSSEQMRCDQSSKYKFVPFSVRTCTETQFTEAERQPS